MTYRVIPQVDFDRAVQKVLACGVARTPAENIVLSIWQICLGLEKDFRSTIDLATSTGSLDVEQAILDRINNRRPPTIAYNKKLPATLTPVVNRELRFNEYHYATEDGIPLISEEAMPLALD
jgi:hypothetical protein